MGVPCCGTWGAGRKNQFWLSISWGRKEAWGTSEKGAPLCGRGVRRRGGGAQSVEVQLGRVEDGVGLQGPRRESTSHDLAQAQARWRPAHTRRQVPGLTPLGRAMLCCRQRCCHLK